MRPWALMARILPRSLKRSRNPGKCGRAENPRISAAFAAPPARCVGEGTLPPLPMNWMRYLLDGSVLIASARLDGPASTDCICTPVDE